jgi:hypothetical protein
MAGEIHLQESKIKWEVRRIPLSADALESVRQLLAPAEKLGANQPDQYLIPALVNSVVKGKDGSVPIRRHDPTRPTKGWRNSVAQTDGRGGTEGPPRSRSPAQLDNQPCRDWHAPVSAGGASRPSVETDVRPLLTHKREGRQESRGCISAGYRQSSEQRRVRNWLRQKQLAKYLHLR